MNAAWHYVQPGRNKIDNVWYCFNTDGVMQTGWLKLNNKWYYFAAGGAMIANISKTINGKVYRFDANGVCLNP